MNNNRTVTFRTGDDAHNREVVDLLTAELQAVDEGITPTVAMQINGGIVRLRFGLAPLFRHAGDENRGDFNLENKQIDVHTEYNVDDILRSVKATIEDYGRNTDDRP